MWFSLLAGGGTQVSYLVCHDSTHLLSSPFCSAACRETQTANPKCSQMCVSPTAGVKSEKGALRIVKLTVLSLSAWGGELVFDCESGCVPICKLHVCIWT